MNNNFQDLMREATRLTQAGLLNEATETIQRALGGAAETRAVSREGSEALTAAAAPLVLDGSKFDADARTLAAAPTFVGEAPAGGSPADAPQAWPLPTRYDGDATAKVDPGEFSSGTHTQASQTRIYKLYAPPGHVGRQLPLVVMLHGCTQDPDDFAAGTGMNEQAREQGFFVLYPAQSQEANPLRCWNWFKRNHQQRDRGEPALIAGMTQAVMEQHDIDARRVYIAGLSAGGAMAAIVAAEYPDIFAAVGVHSGLPCGAASDVAGALAVMKSGAARPASHAKASRFGTPTAAALRPRTLVPTIVFHGDQDQTIHPRNGEKVIADVLRSAGESRALPAHGARVEQGVAAQGQRYTRSIHHADNGDALAEHWLLHGAGHAWSGGHAEGSYTDVKGPDATREMLRFFFSIGAA